MAVQSANVTKFNAGGSGDSIIADGYIKTVEKVWIDSYTFAQTGTNTTIHIAKLDDNKKVTSLQVEIATSASQTNGTISIGYSSSDSNDLAAGGVAQFLAPTTLTHNLTRTSISLPAGVLSGNVLAGGVAVAAGALDGFQAVTSGTNTTIAVKLNNWTMTTGSIKTIVRYT